MLSCKRGLKDNRPSFPQKGKTSVATCTLQRPMWSSTRARGSRALVLVAPTGPKGPWG